VPEAAIKIFYSYARKDRELRDTLDNHLAALQAAGRVETWHDLQLEPGIEWEPDLLARLKAADIILLLISVDFMASKYCYSTELRLAIDRHNAGQAKVIPVILRPCDWNHDYVPFSKLNVLPPGAKPVTSWPDPDEAYAIVAVKIRETVDALKAAALEQVRQEELARVAAEQARQQQEQQRLAAEAEAEQARKMQLEQDLEREQGRIFSFTTARVTGQGEVERTEQQARLRVFELGVGVDLEMVYVPGGSFLMGSNEVSYEQPIHQVTLSAFHIGRYPVTQAQYQAVMGKNPSHFKGNDRYPVESVSWRDAMEFCAKLSAANGGIFTLPSEAQWEYACRAGTESWFAYGDVICTDLANYDGSEEQGAYLKTVTPVGAYPSNPWGLSDMHGNVWEWCRDDWHDNYRGSPTDGSAWINIDTSSNGKVLRGGSWNNNPRNCRSACRYNYFDINFNVGFRVVCCAPKDFLAL
jgi:formylglycine-generating enzyme required for sulfatase activity